MAQQVRLIQGNPQEGTNMAQQVRLIKEILKRIPIWRSKCAELRKGGKDNEFR